MPTLRPVAWLRRLALALLIPVAAMSVAGCGAVTDAPVPASVAPFLESARAELLAQSDDPLDAFAFRSARCRADGGLVLVFDRLRGGGRVGYGFTMSGAPAAEPTGWGGGFGRGELGDDPEVVAFLAGDEVPCA